MLARRNRKLALSVAGAVAMMGTAEMSSAVVNVFNSTTTTVTANNGSHGDTLTMGSLGHLVLNGIASTTLDTYTGTFSGGGTPNRGTAIITINSNAAGVTKLNVGTTAWGFTPNKTDVIIEGNNVGGTANGSVQLLAGTGTLATGMPLFGAAAGVTGYNGTVLVHELTTGDYDFATYDATVGVKALSTANANDYAQNAFTTGANVLWNTAIPALNSGASINSLTLKGNSLAISGTGSITLPSVGAGAGANGILSIGTNNSIAVPVTANATDGLTVHAFNDLTMSGGITSGWLTKANTGKLTLIGATNITSAANFVTIADGTLSVSANNSLGTNNGVLVVLQGGALQVTSNISVAHPLSTYHANGNLNAIEITGSNVVDFTAGIATRVTTNPTTDGGVSFTGTGTAIISGNVASLGAGLNAYTGPTQIKSGTVVANINNALSQTVSVSNGATLRINSGKNLVRAAAGGGTISLTLAGATAHLDTGTAGDTGTAALTGTMTASSGAALDFDFNGSVNDVDLMNISSTVTAGGTFNVNLNDLNLGTINAGTPYTLFTGGTFTGTPTLVGNVTSTHYALDPSYHGNGLFWDTGAKTLTAQFIVTAQNTISLSATATGTNYADNTNASENPGSAVAGAVHVGGTGANYISEVDGLTSNQNAGSATVDNDLGGNIPVYVMLWTQGDATAANPITVTGGQQIATGTDQWNALQAAYGLTGMAGNDFEYLFKFNSNPFTGGAGAVNWSFAADAGVIIDRIAVVPEPTTFGLAGLGALGLIAGRRRRRD